MTGQLSFFRFNICANAKRVGFRKCQELLARMSPQLGSVSMILVLSIGLSQLISNVPFVALFLPARGVQFLRDS